MNPISNSGDHRLGSVGMVALLTAQFLSAMADNLLFVAAIALLKGASGGDALLPVLQVVFVFAFIVLAPFVGPLADGFSKGRVMFYANFIKLAGAGLILFGGNPLLGYAIAGIGAAIYSPAKYGILTQLVHPDKLVKANGLLEGSTIVAILLGVLSGGYLADLSISLAVGVAAGLYLLAAAANLFIPRLPRIHALSVREFRHLPRIFGHNVATLWRTPDARFSILGTSVFWGMGSTLRLLMFAWVPVALGLLDNQAPANLMGVVSIGIIVGAAFAAFTVKLERVNTALWGGLALGPLVLMLAPLHHLELAAAVLFGLGMAGGFFVVPLNALLQERGTETIGAGRTLAVQNLFENTAMLLMAGVYFGLTALGFSAVTVAYGFGVLVLMAISLIGINRLRAQPLTPRNL
ncbi:MAG: lysophospholipid transporter LplT [Halothiobacillaceae bacterium]|nr:lysophospholipid transporter LplT [Halothiobacillaceae bacterium]